ncbi:MAG TPA: putative lipid II flippase FtsW [Rhodanobacteraceae bacterium]|jgi:cell division protein FtsW|nr:putative lipid II flippase FtsW [Rhodanobacteraceae bacterium]
MLLFNLHEDDSQATRRSEPKGRYDLGLILAAIALASVGIVMVASSSIAVADGAHVGPFYYLARHLVFLALGLVACGVLARTELAWIERNAVPFLLIGFVLLLLVFMPGIGYRVNGARRWIHLGVSGFQSVEAVKLFLIVYLASYLVRHREKVQGSFFGVIKPLGIAVLVAGLLLAQPDFGSATLLLAVTLGMVWLGGARFSNLAALGLLALPAIGWAAFSSDYRVKRLTSFLDPWADPFKDGYQLTQALIAIGRGEWFGVGLGGSVQKLFYLPEAHTDFILSVIAEELGFAGIVLVLALFAWLVGRGFQVGLRAVERGQRFAGYCAFGVSLTIALQALVSIGVNLGVLPTKGLTLPLISSGGSSVMMTCAAIGLLIRVSYEVARAENAALQAVPERIVAEVRR